MFMLCIHRRRQAGDAAGSGGPSSILDPAALARLRQLDPDGSRGFLNQLLRTYETTLVRHLATLADSVAAGDVPRAGAVAHTLKSSSASIGALAFASHCAKVESLAKADDVQALGSSMTALQSEGQRVLLAVRAMLLP
jgi:HPt (histidine-containing phosphotransfer) domain-containing protein